MKKYPKLTEEIFSLPQCPDWAVVAVVNEDNECYVYDSDEVELVEETPECYAYWWEGDNIYKVCMGYYDSTNWKDSLVRNPKAKKEPDREEEDRVKVKEQVLKALSTTGMLTNALIALLKIIEDNNSLKDVRTHLNELGPILIAKLEKDIDKARNIIKEYK